MSRPVVKKGASNWEKITTYAMAALVLFLAGFLLIRNEPITDPNFAVGLRIILSAAVGIFIAAIPGFLNFTWTLPSATVRAGGALAFSVLTYLYTPEVFATLKTPTKLSMSVDRYEGYTSRRIGQIGTTTSSANFGDGVRVKVESTAPIYCYLLAYNADGKEQLLSPCGPDALPALGVKPAAFATLAYPPDPMQLYPLNDGTGLQAIVLYASTRPLPTYEKWKLGGDPAALWGTEASNQAWTFDGHNFAGILKSGAPVNMSELPPGFTRLCTFFNERSHVDSARNTLVQAIAFPVVSKG